MGHSGLYKILKISHVPDVQERATQPVYLTQQACAHPTRIEPDTLLHNEPSPGTRDVPCPARHQAGLQQHTYVTNIRNVVERVVVAVVVRGVVRIY